MNLRRDDTMLKKIVRGVSFVILASFFGCTYIAFSKGLSMGSTVVMTTSAMCGLCLAEILVKEYLLK